MGSSPYFGRNGHEVREEGDRLHTISIGGMWLVMATASPRGEEERSPSNNLTRGRTQEEKGEGRIRKKKCMRGVVSSMVLRARRRRGDERKEGSRIAWCHE